MQEKENNKVINAFELGFRKLYQSFSVEDYKREIIEKDLLSNYKDIELNLTSCRLGYPSTPRFIDLFLEHLSKQEGDKSLTIKMGCISYFEWVCLNIIVLEGNFFGVTEKINSTEELDCVKIVINDKLQNNHIHMTIELDNKEKTCFNYGEGKKDE